MGSATASSSVRTSAALKGVAGAKARHCGPCRRNRNERSKRARRTLIVEMRHARNETGARLSRGRREDAGAGRDQRESGSGAAHGADERESSASSASARGLTRREATSRVKRVGRKSAQAGAVCGRLGWASLKRWNDAQQTRRVECERTDDAVPMCCLSLPNALCDCPATAAAHDFVSRCALLAAFLSAAGLLR